MNVMPGLQASRRTGASLAAAAAVALLAGCHSLEVTNPNSPGLARLGGGDVQSFLAGAFGKWYHSLTDITPSVLVDVMADHYESAFSNWGVMRMGWEPRLYPLDNSRADADIEEPWYNNYGALASANLVILALQNGVAIPGPTDSSSNPMILAAARFIQGAALSNIALVFDSGYAVDETADLAKVELVGRDSVKQAALAKLDVAIALASAATSPWSIPESFLNQIGEAWTNTQLTQVASYWAARTLAYFPHNVTENAAADWGKVLSYASKGISAGTPFDMEIVGDGPGTPAGWRNDHMGFGTAIFDWARVNQRVTCLLDPAYKCHRPNNAVNQPIPRSADYRFNGDDVVGDNCVPAAVAAAIARKDPSGSSYGAYCSTADKQGGADFVYLPLSGSTWPGFPSARGYWRFSNVGFIRYFANGWDSPNSAVGRLPFVLAAENDLLRAEALVRTGLFTMAAGLINKTRVGRGHLPALTGTETRSQLLDAIIYERGIELYAAGPMVPWYDQRRWAPSLTNPHYYVAVNDSDQTGWLPYGKGLQPGTPRLFPVPARELTMLGHPVYTFGGYPCGGPNGMCPNPGGAAAARSIFGTTPDGRQITGPGRWAAIADSIIGVRRRAHQSRPM